MLREQKLLRVIHANVLGLITYYSKQSPSDFKLEMYLHLEYWKLFTHTAGLIWKIFIYIYQSCPNPKPEKKNHLPIPYNYI